MTNLRDLLITVSMPPGVEHVDTVASRIGKHRLITVSMPPGVEHHHVDQVRT